MATLEYILYFIPSLLFIYSVVWTKFVYIKTIGKTTYAVILIKWNIKKKVFVQETRYVYKSKS